MCLNACLKNMMSYDEDNESLLERSKWNNTHEKIYQFLENHAPPEFGIDQAISLICLLSNERNLDSVKPGDRQKRNLLHFSIEKQKITIFVSLLAYGANFRQTTARGDTILHLLMREGLHNWLECLPLLELCNRGRYYFDTSYKDIHTLFDKANEKAGNTPLLTALLEFRLSSAKYLLESNSVDFWKSYHSCRTPKLRSLAVRVYESTTNYEKMHALFPHSAGKKSAKENTVTVPGMETSTANA